MINLVRRFIASMSFRVGGSRDRGAEKAPASKWREGGLYAAAEAEGRYKILKILKVEKEGVHLRYYSNVYDHLPKQIDESELFIGGIDLETEEVPGAALIGIGHAPVSHETISDWDLRFIQQSSVTPEELDGYNAWLEARGGYF
jgi:hypothetical protein